MKGHKAVGDAIDVYSFALISPAVIKTKKSDGSNSQSARSERSAASSQAEHHNVGEELVAECHIGFEKLLGSLFQF